MTIVSVIANKFAISNLLRKSGFSVNSVLEIERYEERTTNKE